jgi:hypothetical protein
MKLKKVINNSNLQVYFIHKPTKEFKKTFPKKYIIAALILGKEFAGNYDVLPPLLAFGVISGYIFTYSKHMPSFLGNRPPPPNVGHTAPTGLDTFFVSSDKVNIVLNCKALEYDDFPLQWMSDVTIKGDISNLAECPLADLPEKYNPKTFQENIMKIVKTQLFFPNSLEDWVKEICNRLPATVHDNPIKYPKFITESTLKKCSLPKKFIFVEYDFRLESKQNIYRLENSVINMIEEAFEENQDIIVNNTYNDIIPALKKQLKKQHIKFSEVNNGISLKLYDFWKVKFRYDLTDFF